MTTTAHTHSTNVAGRTNLCKTGTGNFFEDFALGQTLAHATPRTVTSGDAAIYTALYGARFAVNCADEFARNLGLPSAPIDDLLVFHLIFGKSVPDVSLNAVANLGYAGGRFGVPVFAGDTLSARSEVIGLKENSNGKTGTVYVRTVGTNQRNETVLEYCRWVMVRKRGGGSSPPTPVVPDLPDAAVLADLVPPADLDARSWDAASSGSAFALGDYSVGEKLAHVDGMTIEEADHMSAARLYQNTARVHFNQHVEAQGRFGRRIVYGGHVISLARALSFNGLGNAFRLAAINAGTHAHPVFAGDTIYAWSEVLEVSPLAGTSGLGAMRLRTVAAKDDDCSSFPLKGEDGRYLPQVVLDLDYVVLMPLHILEERAA